MNTSVLAHWVSRSRKHWLTLLKGPHGYRYEAPSASGTIVAESDSEAIAMMERRLTEFQPDKARTPMRRSGLDKERHPKCSVCRKPAGTNPSCDRCASYRRMVQERDNPTPEQLKEKAEWQQEFQKQREAQSDVERARRMRLSGRTITVGLVGCGKTKLDHPAPAQDLYVSPLFRAARRYAERCCDEWVILSGGHGVLLPEAVISPYELSLTKMRLREKEHWADRVTNYLRQHYAELDVRYIGLAGEEYLSRLGVPVEWPLDGLGIGERVKRLQQMVGECSALEREVAERMLGRVIERKRALLPEARRSEADAYWMSRRGLYLFLAEQTVVAQRRGSPKASSAEWAVGQLGSELRHRARNPQTAEWLQRRAAQLAGYCRAIWDEAYTDGFQSIPSFRPTGSGISNKGKKTNG